MRYATGWGHTPAEYAKALAAGEPVPLKTTTHPATGEPFVSVYRTALAMPSSSKRANEPDSVEVVVKVCPLPGVGKQIQSLLKRTKHHRQWRGHELLHAAGVPSAAPLAILRARAPDGEAEVMILAHAEGKTLLERFSEYQDGLPLPPLIAPALAHTITQLEQHRLWNRDPKPSNILTQQPEPGGFEITLLDTVGVERRSSKPHDLLRHVLGLILLESRGSGAPCPPQFTAELARAALQLRAKRGTNTGRLDDRVNQLLREVEREIEHRDGSPEDRPLPPSV